MLISLRSSGAKYIYQSRVISDDIAEKILKSSDISSTDFFFKENEIEMFVVPFVVPELLQMQKNKTFHGDIFYSIDLIVGKIKYRLKYNAEVKPDFFKVLFKFFYPDQAEKQIEELI